jgi:hypothetical protein
MSLICFNICLATILMAVISLDVFAKVEIFDLLLLLTRPPFALYAWKQ